jgi:hypothetical protein
MNKRLLRPSLLILLLLRKFSQIPRSEPSLTTEKTLSTPTHRTDITMGKGSIHFPTSTFRTLVLSILNFNDEAHKHNKFLILQNLSLTFVITEILNLPKIGEGVWIGSGYDFSDIFKII